MMRILVLNRTVLATFIITLTFTAYTIVNPVNSITSRYYCVGFQDFYSFEYTDVLHTLSLTIKGPLPVISRGYTSHHDFGLLVQEMASKYGLVNKEYAWIILEDVSTTFYSVGLPLIILFASIFYAVALDAISVHRALQVIASIGVRRYYLVITSVALLSSLVYTAVLIIPITFYVCPSCSFSDKFVGSSSLFLTFSTVLLLEALIYVASAWNAISALLAGITASIVALSYPGLLARIANVSKRLFGIEVQASMIASLAIQVGVLALVAFVVYIVMARREVY